MHVSDVQLKSLSSYARERYIHDLGVRLTERSPLLVRSFDQGQLHRVVSSAVAAAEARGLTNRGPIRLYLDLCIAFGSGFADDPMYPWARAALGRPDPETQHERAEALYTRSGAAIEAIHGPDEVHTRTALAATLAWASQEQRFPPAERLAAHIANQLAALHPQKAAHGGPQALQMLVAAAAQACARHGVTAPRAQLLMAGLQFALGAACLGDPAHAWIAATLADPAVPDPAQRFAALERQALARLQAAAAHSTQEA